MVEKLKNKKQKHIIYCYVGGATDIEKIMTKRKIPFFKDHIWDVSFSMNLYVKNPSTRTYKAKKIKITIEEIK